MKVSEVEPLVFFWSGPDGLASQDVENEIDRILAIGKRRGLGTLFARSILVKGNRVVILRGTWHVAPIFFLENVQEDIDLATELGFTIFKESYDIRGVNIYWLGFSGLAIYYFLHHILPTFYKMEATLNREHDESDILVFPSHNTEWTDMGPEIINHLKNIGFCFYWPFFLLIHLAIIINFKIKEDRYGHQILSFIFSKGDKVFLDLRDELVVNAIEASGLERIYVHYGDGHVETMRNRLIAKGWKPFYESRFFPLDHTTFKELISGWAKALNSRIKAFIKRAS